MVAAINNGGHVLLLLRVALALRFIAAPLSNAATLEAAARMLSRLSEGKSTPIHIDALIG
jgi:hypothetical protein